MCFVSDDYGVQFVCAAVFVRAFFDAVEAGRIGDIVEKSLSYVFLKVVKPYVMFAIETIEPDLASIQNDGVFCWFEPNSTMCAVWRKLRSEEL